MAVWSKCVPLHLLKFVKAFYKALSGHSYGEAEGNYWESEDCFYVIGLDETAESPR